jgi:hypothetical protein
MAYNASKRWCILKRRSLIIYNNADNSNPDKKTKQRKTQNDNKKKKTKRKRTAGRSGGRWRGGEAGQRCDGERGDA